MKAYWWRLSWKKKWTEIRRNCTDWNVFFQEMSVYEDTVIGHFFPTWSEYYYYVLTLQDYKLKTCRRTQSISVSNRMSPTSKHKEIRNELACLFPENRSTHNTALYCFSLTWSKCRRYYELVPNHLEYGKTLPTGKWDEDFTCWVSTFKDLTIQGHDNSSCTLMHEVHITRAIQCFC